MYLEGSHTNRGEQPDSTQKALGPVRKDCGPSCCEVIVFIYFSYLSKCIYILHQEFQIWFEYIMNHRISKNLFDKMNSFCTPEVSQTLMSMTSRWRCSC